MFLQFIIEQCPVAVTARPDDPYDPLHSHGHGAVFILSTVQLGHVQPRLSHYAAYLFRVLVHKNTHTRNIVPLSRDATCAGVTFRGLGA